MPYTPPSIPAIDRAAREAMQKKLDGKTKPLGALGRIEALAVDLAGMVGGLEPGFEHKAVLVAAADHGIARKGVSLYPSEVTRQMVLNFMAGGAGVNVLARRAGARVVVVDAGIQGERLPAAEGFHDLRVMDGSQDMSEGPAMARAQAEACLAAGAKVLRELHGQGVRLLALGEMGIGNTSPSSAIAAVLLGQPVATVTGRGAGLDAKAWERKVELIERSIAVNRPEPQDGIGLLAKVGGLEIGVLAGAILEAASLRMPVMLDGFISGAAALVACAIAPAAKGYLLAGHQSVEIGHRFMLEWLGLKPLLQLELRLGEGTGACLALPLVDAACAVVREMATFESAGVSTEKLGEDAFDTQAKERA